MISESCAIEEFVEAVQGKGSEEVIELAVEEATTADRLAYHARRRLNNPLLTCQSYSRHLKRLINYLRYEIKPHRPADRVYQLYRTHWGVSGDRQTNIADRMATTG